MQLRNILLEREKAVLTVTINRPKVLNAIDFQTLEELYKVINDVETDATVRAIIITGAGEKAFCSGADLKEVKKYTASAVQATNRRGRILFWHKVFNGVVSLIKPVIAAINGYALGAGLELATACDLRICSENAKFGCPEINFGSFPAGGGIHRLLQLVGHAKTKELIFLGQMINAHEALRINLVNKVVPGYDLLKVSRELAHKITEKSPIAIRIVKARTNATISTEMSEVFYEALGEIVCRDARRPQDWDHISRHVGNK